MASQYLIQVVDTLTGRVVQWAPGLQVERALVDDVCTRVEAKKVGVGRTTATVVAAVREALEEALHDLKSDVKPV